MTKLSIVSTCLICILTLGCKQTQTKRKAQETKQVDNLQSDIDEYKKTIPATIKDPQNDEWRSNVYRNTFYKFRVEFPKDWEYDAGTTKTTLARALNREYAAAISITVTHLPNRPRTPIIFLKALQ